ncbi:hypothetical protein GCM10009557_01050 [Virgisporangium ochraceum]|uniref:HTH cro/C1-type domain-containing protein n=1 Tax=Virgisporangium ochraceum TaxID=65505 RepID=A0A8J4A421_9ACTN|nr:helix-turn-helix transcriptional regulator [Virgisporangium ochraceum]GIJ74137.1 hypothetical protein Voc01_090540 [Virgisporangium ochraceum]
MNDDGFPCPSSQREVVAIEGRENRVHGHFPLTKADVDGALARRAADPSAGHLDAITLDHAWSNAASTGRADGLARDASRSTFADMMKELRQRKGWSYRQLARSVHYSYSYLWQLEVGAKQATEAVAVAIDTALEAGGALVELARHSVATPQAGWRAAQKAAADMSPEEFVSVPVETAHGVVAYLVTRRSSLSGLAAMMPVSISAGWPTSTAEGGDVRDSLAEMPNSAREVLDGRHVEWSSFLTVTQLLASQRQAIAPEALLSLVEAHRDCLARLLRSAASDPVRYEIALLLGETSIVASRLWSAKGRREMAIASCAYARQLADRIDAPGLGATARIFESNLHSEAATLIGADGDILLGLRMLDEAASMERHITPAARARIAAEQAQAFAVLGLRGDCMRALERARIAVDQIDDTDRSGLFSDWSPSRLDVYEGTCWLFLDEPKKAVQILSRSVRDAEPDRSNRNVHLAAQVDLGSAYAESGELEEGCMILGETYAQLVESGSHRGVDRALCARDRLQRWNHESSVRDLDELIAAIH